MTIIGLSGPMSSGKSVTSIYVAEEYMKEKDNLISNMSLNIPKFKYLTTEELIYKAFNDSMFFWNSVLLIDEVHNIVDARKSSSNLNQKFTQFITQIGKLDCTVILTSQILKSQVDLRLRAFMEIFIECRRGYLDKNNKFKPLPMYKRIHKDKKIRIQIKWQKKEFDEWSLPRYAIFNPKPYYEKYNTHEIILVDRDKFLVQK